MVRHAPHLGPVQHGVAHLLLVEEEVGEEVALAAPEVVGQEDGGEGGVAGQLPHGEVVQEVPVQPQYGEGLEAGEGLGRNTLESNW